MVDYRHILHRHLTGPLLEALADTPAVLANGARQTGKGTLVQSAEVAGQKRQYLSFDDPGILSAAKRDPNGLREFVINAGRTKPRLTLTFVRPVILKARVDHAREISEDDLAEHPRPIVTEHSDFLNM
jgi:hypothetical protein